MSHRFNFKLIRIVIIGTLGTVIEWAEYAYYGYMAVRMAELFFPQQGVQAGLISAFAMFAAGFIMRPLGAIMVSHIADRSGRKKALLFSMLLMGIATFAIGILPTHAQVGLLAPMLLLICRLTQGLALASECLGAAVFLIEHAGGVRPYLNGSWPGMASALGITLGGIAATWVSSVDLVWAWRIPFIFGAMGCLLALYLRRKIAESPVFLAAQQKNQLVKMPFFAIFSGHWHAIIKTAAMVVFVATIVYVCNLYFVTYLTQMAKMTPHRASLITTMGEVVVVLFYPLCGWLADKWDGIKQMQLGLLLFVFAAPLMFVLGKTGSIALALLAQFMYGFFNAFITAPIFKWFYDLFPTPIRVTGISVSWNVAVALLGGTAPLIVQYLVAQLGWLYGPGFYTSAIALVTLFIMRSATPASRQELLEITITN